MLKEQVWDSSDLTDDHACFRNERLPCPMSDQRTDGYYSDGEVDPSERGTVKQI